MGLSSVLPFLAALQKQQGISPSTFQQGADAPAALSGGPVDMTGNVNAPSQVAAAQAAPPNPPPPPPQDPQPDMSIGAPPAPQQPPPNPVGDIAQSMTEGERAPKYQPTKGHLLLSLLQSGLVGGLSGQAANAATYAQTGRSGGFGGGIGAGYTQALPIQAALQRLGLQKAGLENEQLIQMLPFLRAQQIAELNVKTSAAQKNVAEAGKAGAEAGAIPVKTQLEEAQTQAAYYKDDPNLGLIDIRTGQPVAGGAASAPLTEQEAGVLGKQPGERVPLKIKNQANEIVNRGIKSVQAGGRSLLVDNQGNTIKDMGAATPLVTMGMQLNAPTQISPEMTQAATMVANGQVDLATAARPFMRFPGQYMAFLSEIEKQKPGYFQGNFEAAKKVLDSATSGPIANEINANNTALAHADLLQRAAGALGNGDQQTLNGLKNSFANEFGSTGPVTAQAIADAYTREITKMLSAGHLTDSEIGTIGKTLDPRKQSLAQIQSVLGAYKALAASKLQQRQNQVTQGMKGQPNFPAAQAPAGATGIAPGSDGKRHYHDAQGNDLGVAP